ncbi:CPBP family glutamic-type intramembrane protease [Paenibacillus sp. Marseille-Q7038]
MMELDRHRKSGHSHWQAFILLGWLTMTIGLFKATVMGQWIRFMGGSQSVVLLIQAVVVSIIIIPTFFLIQHRFGTKLKLLPISLNGLLCFLCGFGLPLLMTGMGLFIAESQQWVTITEWHLAAELLVAISGNLLIAVLYEALPEELTLRGLVYSGLRMRLPVIFAYMGQVILFVLVPVAVLALQKLTGITAGGAITVEYVILLLCFGVTLQLWRSLTDSLWASIGFHLAYLGIARFVILPRGDLRVITYTEHEAGTGDLFILFGMVILSTALILLIIKAGQWVVKRR